MAAVRVGYRDGDLGLACFLILAQVGPGGELVVLRRCLSLQGCNSVRSIFRMIGGGMRRSSSSLGKNRRIIYFVGITEGKRVHGVTRVHKAMIYWSILKRYKTRGYLFKKRKIRA